MSGKDTLLEVVAQTINDLKDAVTSNATQQGTQVSDDNEGWSAGASIKAAFPDAKLVSVKSVKEATPPTPVVTKGVDKVVPELREPEVFDRGDKGRFVWVPKALRTFIYMNLDVNGLFHPDVLRADESKYVPMEQRLLKNSYAIPVYDFLPRVEEIRDEFADHGYGDLDQEDRLRFDKLLELLVKEQDLLEERFKNVNSPDAEVTAEELCLFLNTRDRMFSTAVNGSEVAFMSEKAKIVRSFFGSYISVNGSVHVNFGEGIQKVGTEFEIPMFDGKKRVSDTGINMLEIDPALREQLIARGKRYVELTSKPAYVQYTGSILRRSWWSSNRFKATGRVMIDMASMRVMDTDYRYYFGWDQYRRRESAAEPVSGGRKFSDEEYATMSPFVYGFSFISKVWGEMSIDNVSDIQFRENAYDMLVLDEERKDMMFSLVENGMAEGDKDFIGGKGGGVIFMLAGTPGTGKTLSAEAIAEKLKRPLYMVGVGELGTDVQSLESSLRNILDIATKWNAVLLLDECDIFMEARNNDDVERNAMVGIFLRLLEYYEGILFLTTNRADNIDEAFYSRISMALYYDPLSEETRRQVWKNLLATYKVENIDPAALAAHDLNGRKIKQVIRIASALARAKKREPNVEDFRAVIQKEMDFRAAIEPVKHHR